MKSLNYYLLNEASLGKNHWAIADIFFKKNPSGGKMSYTWERGDDSFEITGDYKKFKNDEYQSYPVIMNGEKIGEAFYVDYYWDFNVDDSLRGKLGKIPRMDGNDLADVLGKVTNFFK